MNKGTAPKSQMLINREIRKTTKEIHTMEFENRPWILNQNPIDKEIHNLKEAIEVAHQEKIDITNRLEDLMQLEGRSLSEYHELREAAIAEVRLAEAQLSEAQLAKAELNAYWPVDYDSDDDSTDCDEVFDTDELVSRYGDVLFTISELDNDDTSDLSADAEEDDHLYNFPLPTNISPKLENLTFIKNKNMNTNTNTNNENIKPTYTMPSINTTAEEEHIAKMLAPSTFDWADDSDEFEVNTTAEEEHTAKMLAPSTFDWADDSDDEFEDITNTALRSASYIEAQMDNTQQQSPPTTNTAEGYYDEDGFYVDPVFDDNAATTSDTIDNDENLSTPDAEDEFDCRLMNNLHCMLEAFQGFYGENSSRQSPVQLAQRHEPVQLGNYNKCQWKVHPLAMTKANLNPPLTGTPTIRLTTPGGQLCELEETFLDYSHPSWIVHFFNRHKDSLILREKVESWENEEETRSRLKAEAYVSYNLFPSHCPFTY